MSLNSSLARLTGPLALLALAAPMAQAQSILRVASGQSIQRAVGLAIDGDTVLVEPGTYAPFSFQGKAILVVSRRGAAVTTIDAHFAGPGVGFVRGETAASKLQGFTIQRGAPGVLAVSKSRPGTGHTGTSLFAKPTIMDCIITQNPRGVTGDPILVRCSISNNGAGTVGRAGAGIYGAPVLTDCVLAGNQTEGGLGGAALFVPDGKHAKAVGTVFANNICTDPVAPLQGEAGAAVHGRIKAARCLFYGNATTGFDGAAGAILSADPCTLINCTFVGNTSAAVGAVSAPGQILNTLFHDNGVEEVRHASMKFCHINSTLPGAIAPAAAPGFISETDLDFHLSATSPLINAGSPVLSDPDGSRSDIGAFPYEMLYAESNVRSSAWLDPSWSTLSLRMGGKQVFRLAAGASNAGKVYRLGGSFTGTAPGVTLFGVHIPLNIDSYTTITFLFPDRAPLSGFLGLLDADGRATASFTIQPNELEDLEGTDLHHAFAVIGSRGLELSSQALTLSLVR